MYPTMIQAVQLAFHTHKRNSVFTAPVALAGNMSVSSTFSALPCPLLLLASWLVPSKLMAGKQASHAMLLPCTGLPGMQASIVLLQSL